jgi:hypothetical protein
MKHPNIINVPFLTLNDWINPPNAEATQVIPTETQAVIMVRVIVFFVRV